MQLKKIVDDYSEGMDENLEDDDGEKGAIKSLLFRGKLLDLATRANKYDRTIIEVINVLDTFTTNNNTSKGSESNLESSFVHPILNGLFKAYNVVPHSCNQRIDTTSIVNRRPDYVVDHYANKEHDTTTVYGEIKANDAPNKLDLLRIAHFCQKALDDFSLNMTMGFQVVGEIIQHRIEKIDCFIEVGSLKIPKKKAE